MSTEYGFACLSHTPFVQSDDFCYAEEPLTAMLACRSTGVAYTDLQVSGSRGWAGAAAEWLEKHPHCFVSVVTEYGELRGPVCPPERYVEDP